MCLPDSQTTRMFQSWEPMQAAFRASLLEPRSIYSQAARSKVPMFKFVLATTLLALSRALPTMPEMQSMFDDFTVTVRRVWCLLAARNMTVFHECGQPFDNTHLGDAALALRMKSSSYLIVIFLGFARNACAAAVVMQACSQPCTTLIL